MAEAKRFCENNIFILIINHEIMDRMSTTEFMNGRGSATYVQLLRQYVVLILGIIINFQLRNISIITARLKTKGEFGIVF